MMQDDPHAESEAVDDVTDDGAGVDGGDVDEASRVAAYDLDGDGHVSVVEDARATLGLVDARLEQVEDEGGVKGKIAGVAHRIVDKLDND